MSITTYNIQLKGYVSGWDFDRADVDDMLAQNEGKPVNVLMSPWAARSPPVSQSQQRSNNTTFTVVDTVYTMVYTDCVN